MKLRILRFGLLQDADVGSASFRSVWKSISGYFLFADKDEAAGAADASRVAGSKLVLE
jgi:hypothetical protein